jgi:hypothetical protein
MAFIFAIWILTPKVTEVIQTFSLQQAH